MHNYTYYHYNSTGTPISLPFCKRIIDIINVYSFPKYFVPEIRENRGLEQCGAFVHIHINDKNLTYVFLDDGEPSKLGKILYRDLEENKCYDDDSEPKDLSQIAFDETNYNWDFQYKPHNGKVISHLINHKTFIRPKLMAYPSNYWTYNIYLSGDGSCYKPNNNTHIRQVECNVKTVTGDGNGDEEIYTITIHSDSGSPAATQILVSSVGFDVYNGVDKISKNILLV